MALKNLFFILCGISLYFDKNMSGNKKENIVELVTRRSGPQNRCVAKKKEKEKREKICTLTRT